MVQVAATGAVASPIIINNVTDLENISFDLSGDYVLGGNIDASAATSWHGGAGLSPIGTAATPFRGAFNGSNYTISGLSINLATSDYVGLFGANSGSIRNITLSNNNLVGRSYAGALVGYNNGTILNAHTSGNVVGTDMVGGLVGNNFNGFIENSSASGSIKGNFAVGGLVGASEYSAFASPTTIKNSSSAGTVLGLNYVGGLVGINQGGVINNGHSTASVAVDLGGGGLVGLLNTGSITNSSARGSVTGARGGVGGLVGVSSIAGIDTSFATGAVTSSSGTGVGGLIGDAVFTNVNNTYALGAVAGLSHVGGLVGGFSGTVSQGYSIGKVSGEELVGGLVGALNPRFGDVVNGYWNTQSSGRLSSDGGVGLATAELKSGILPAGFDPAIWRAGPGQYPTLQWQPPQNLTTAPVLINAVLSKLAYFSADDILSGRLPADYKLPEGYKLLDSGSAPRELNGTGLATGLHAVAFDDGKGGITVAFRGTSNPFVRTAFFDTGFAITENPTLKPVYSQALDFVILLKGRGPITLTGHSLGGGIAQLVGMQENLQTVTFNAPGVKLAQSALLIPNSDSNNSNIVNYRVQGDVISLLPHPETQVGELVTLPSDVSNNPLRPQLSWYNNHVMDTVYRLLRSEVAPVSDLHPDAGGHTDTLSLRIELLQSLGLLVTQPVPASLSLLGGLVTGIEDRVIDTVFSRTDLFEILVRASVTTMFMIFDPIGLEFRANVGSPLFASILLPSQIGQFVIQTFVDGLWVDNGMHDPLSTFRFGDAGVAEFRLLNIVMDPHENLPFFTGLTFSSDGLFVGTVSALTEPNSIGEPNTAWLLLFPIMLLSVRSGVRAAQRSVVGWVKPALASMRGEVMASMAGGLELWPSLGDGGLRKAAYRGG